MEATAKTQRRRAYRKTIGSSAVRIEMKDAMGNPRGATADLVDIIDGGLGLALGTPVNCGSIVVVRGKLGESHPADHVKAVVRWCVGKTDGTFRAGLEFLDFRSTFAPNKQSTHSIHSDTPDWYEVMQLNPNADTETISRAYRLLALRYHPDNIETGNNEMFIRLSEAYQILSDPTKRATYDARRRGVKQPSTGNEGAKRKPHNVTGESSVSRPRERQGGFRPSVGALCGWDAALRAL